MKGINNRFDTEIDFVESIMEEVGETRELSDDMFSQACEEFGIDEEEAMGLLMFLQEYEFIRLNTGWSIRSR